MRFTNPKSLAVFTALPLLANCFSITETTDYDTVASAMFTGPGLTIMAVTVLGESSMGTFTDGPFGLGSGGILTSGTATGAYLMGNRNVDNGVGAGGQYDYLCAPGTQNINTLQVQLGFDPGYNGVRIEFVFATQEAPSALANMDAISILDASNGPPVQYAFDSNANQINALSPFLLAPDAIFPPDSLTGYTRSSPPLVRTIPAPSGGAMVLMISVCDVGDAFNDSGFLVRAEACVDCDYGLDKVEINYAFETSTLPPGEQPFTSTIPASGTASGTFIVFVEPTGVTTTTSGEPTTTGETTTTTDEATTTTTAEPTTTTTDDFTTTTGEVTTTMDESLTTAETTITTIDELTITELVSTTETMTLVVDETTTTTADVTTESGSTIEATATTEQSATAVTSELETLTTDEVSTSMADTTTSIQIESPASTDTKSVPSTTSEFASTSVDQGPVLASDTTTSESAVSTTEELITSTAASTSASSSVIPEASSESTPSSLVSTVLPSISSTSTSFAEEGKTSTLEVVPDTTSAPVEPVTSMSQESPTISSSDAPPATSSPFDGPSNIDTIPALPWPEAGPTLESMTGKSTSNNRPSSDSNHFYRSCYASDSLDATSLVLNGRCDIPCPGDSSHFCGGLVVSSSERRWVGPRKALDTRAAPADILLTLYALNDEPPSPGETSTEVEVTATTQDGVTAIPTDVIPSRPVTTVTDIMTESVILQPVETAIDSITRSGQTLVETTVTTVTYTIVNPNNPSTMTVTEYCATLFYEPCSRCAHPPVPTVEMTTYVVPCNACGHNGENEVTITAPCAAVTEPARNDAHGSQDLFNAFAPTRAACHAVSGPVRTVTTALRDTKPTAGAGSGHIESATPNQHQPSEGKNTYPGAGHAQPHAVPSQSSSGASGNGSAVPEVLVAEAGRYERGILGSLTMVFIAVGVLL
ncbi:hypothetical protein HZS61_002170 [Fusarium oxysporum f. sp. conglutinans]|uniref:WSC domain-containing protein n=1 Tax=Fusarium oxysporum f. sp. conglutinans TaxID=100902 RepID=A0A8H6GI02_FUSOX|nr:hypothetical protein HZS61_002170 [Fusarium oxysporum f. sp. conglutinans]KAG7000827.1 hypothetical protein FocnCong_v012326 [Fusarium oxysporum f. sp. conglutinans]